MLESKTRIFHSQSRASQIKRDRELVMQRYGVERNKQAASRERKRAVTFSEVVSYVEPRVLHACSPHLSQCANFDNVPNVSWDQSRHNFGVSARELCSVIHRCDRYDVSTRRDSDAESSSREGETKDLASLPTDRIRQMHAPHCIIDACMHGTVTRHIDVWLKPYVRIDRSLRRN